LKIFPKAANHVLATIEHYSTLKFLSCNVGQALKTVEIDSFRLQALEFYLWGLRRERTDWKFVSHI
jgi:hypothetical protein